MWLDRERNHEELSRFSRADADAYLRLLDEYDEVKHIFGAGAVHAARLRARRSNERLAEHPAGRRWQRRSMMSAWDVVRHEFESPHVRSFMLWQAYQTLVPVDAPGSGPAGLLDRLRPPAAQLDAAARRLGLAHRGARALHRGRRRHRRCATSASPRSCSRAAAARASRPRTASATWRARPSSRRSTSST